LDATRYFAEIAERLAPANRPGFAALFVALLRELVKGRPVAPRTLASALDWPVEGVTAVLERAQEAEYDDAGNIVGYALTLRETAHALEIDGQRLYTWCALDTLIFPAVLGRTARVLSNCAATGAPIVLTISPNGIEEAEPPDPALSLIVPSASGDIRHSFCCHVNFFASASAADGWISRHVGTEVASIREACQLGRRLAGHLLRAATVRDVSR
jgi:alkylmercury lyase